MSQSSASLRRLALALSVVIYAVISSTGFSQWVASAASGIGLPETILEASVASLTLVAVFLVTYRVMQRIWIRRIHGTWLYRSTSGNAGLAEIRIVGDDIRYSVELFESVKDLLDSINGIPGASQKCFGHARSRVAIYDGEKLEIVYSIQQSNPDYPSREGLLTLVKTSNPAELKGYWKSDIEGGAEPRRGTLDFMREKSFRRYVERMQSSSEPE
jgi:hypothetical protein